ncbi:MAG: MBL fold metallo-hydrolase [Marinilabiliaceae bacterium]|nr:MBL fold metallo-hydrolase [Marinilabiliaceae bacterium]
MINIKRLTFNPQNENTYIISDETKECLIIDCGCFSPGDQYMLASYVDVHNLRPVGAICTHLHLDHICGNGFINRRFGLKPEAHTDDEYLMGVAHYQALALGIEEDNLEFPRVDCHLKENDIVHFGQTELTVIHTPGHSLGSISLYSRADSVIFTGDTLMRGTIGTYRLPGGDQEQLVDSIKNKLFQLPYNVMVFPGHGEITTIGYERANNEEVNRPIDKTLRVRKLKFKS